MSVGARIREARKDLGLSQIELAERVGIKQSSLSELERGESQSTTMIATFAAALKVTPLWLETGKGPKQFVVADPAAAESDLRALAELAVVFTKLPEKGRQTVIEFVRTVGVEYGVRRDAAANDQF